MGEMPPRMGCCIEWIDESGGPVVGLVAVFVDRVERADGWSGRVSVRHSRARLPSPQTVWYALGYTISSTAATTECRHWVRGNREQNP